MTLRSGQVFYTITVVLSKHLEAECVASGVLPLSGSDQVGLTWEPPHTEPLNQLLGLIYYFCFLSRVQADSPYVF